MSLSVLRSAGIAPGGQYTNGIWILVFSFTLVAGDSGIVNIASFRPPASAVVVGLNRTGNGAGTPGHLRCDLQANGDLRVQSSDALDVSSGFGLIIAA